jgi:hypothetical protein
LNGCTDSLFSHGHWGPLRLLLGGIS